MQEPKINIKHSRIEINNYEWGDCSKIEYTFSVYNPVYHSSFIKGIEYDEDNKRLFVPRGIDISWLERLFCEQPVVDRNCDPWVNTDPIPIKYLARDDQQIEALKFILGKEKYYYTKTKSQLSINMGTGKGKTFITIASICFTGSRAIIITSSVNWLKQWEDKILEYTPLDKKKIYMITGAASIDKILNRDPLQYQIFLASHSTLRSYGEKYGWNAIDNLFKYLKCGLKVYDEAHLYFDNICKIDYHSNTKRTLYLTATPERSDREENVIYQYYFRNIPSIDLFDEDKDPHTDYIALHFSSHPSVMDVNKCKNAYGFNRIAYTNYVIDRPQFKQLVIIIIEKLLSINGKALIYIGTNQAIKQVYDFIISEFPFLNGNVGIYTSAVTENKSEQLKRKFILSTTKSTGAASDIPDLAVTVNLAEPFKSPVLAQQTLGRTRAKNTFYLDVVDNGFYFTKKYYKEKKSVFNMYAKSCSDVIFSDIDLEQQANAISNKYSTYKVMCMPVFKK